MTDSNTVEAVAQDLWGALVRQCASTRPELHHEVKVLVQVKESDIAAAITALQSLGWQSPSESTAENTALLVALADIRIKTGVGATPMLTELAEAIASKQKAEVEAARVAAQREAFARAKHAFLAETKKWIDPNGSPEKQYANDVAFRVLDKLRALSPSPGPWQRVPEGTPIEDAAIWAREKAAMKRPFDEVDLELQAELQKDCLSDLDKAHAMISEVKP